jgi:hypothetical protein
MSLQAVPGAPDARHVTACPFVTPETPIPAGGVGRASATNAGVPHAHDEEAVAAAGIAHVAAGNPGTGGPVGTLNPELDGAGPGGLYPGPGEQQTEEVER